MSDAPVPSGPEELRVARGTIAQQVAQVVGALAMLVVLTVVGRTLPLAEFGLYGLLISLASYLLILQTSIEGATINAIAKLPSVPERDRVFSLAIVLYLAAGALAGLVIAGGGLLVVEVLPVPESLDAAARSGVVALGAATAIGWPFKVFQDYLRGSQRFFDASAAEILAQVTLVAGIVALVAADAPLWALVALGGSLPTLIGVGSFVVLVATRTRPRFDARGVDRGAARELLGFSAYLSAVGVADAIIYSVDRVVLAAFTSTATLGLYEGAARPHMLVRQVQGTLSITVFPVASAYGAAGDEYRLRELLLRGTRYVHAAVVPLTVVLVVLAGPILEVWLGEDFTEAGLAMSILASQWLLNGATGVGGSMLAATGHVRWITRYSWAIAAANLVSSIALTAWLGLEGVMLGTVIPYVLGFPFFLRKLTSSFPVSFRDLFRIALAPAWAVGAVLAGELLLLRALVDPSSLLELVAIAIPSLAGAYLAYYALFFRANERRLVRGLLRPRA